MKIQRHLAPVLCLALMAVASVAEAQRVVVLDLQGDRGGRVRQAVVKPLLDGGELEVVPLRQYTQAAQRRGFRGPKANTPAAVAAVSGPLKFQAAITGRVTAKSFTVRILDPEGKEVWTRAIPLKGGRLSAQDAQRLAKVIVTAARTEPKQPEPPPEPVAPPEPPPPAVVEVEPKVQPDPTPPTPGRTLPGADVTQPRETAAERARRLRDEERESHTQTTPLRDQDLDTGFRRAPKVRAAPKLVTFTLGGTTVWRSYCSRPGVESCGAYDALADDAKPPGDTVNFSAQRPYAGFGLGVDFFPLASFDGPVNGIGLSGAFARGFSSTLVRVQTPTGEQPPTEVISLDDAWHAALVYRYHFTLGSGRSAQVGYAGLRGGIAARSFEVDPTAQVPLPGSHRQFPFAGLEVSIPIVPLARVEAMGLYFVNPKAGVDELARYGADTEGRGFGVEAGLAGDVWGPVGYSLKFRLQRFGDRFVGQGTFWRDGGAAEETYAGVFWGVTASF